MNQILFSIAICFALTACDKVVDKVADKLADKVAQRAEQKAVNKAGNTSIQEVPGKVSQKVPEKVPEKAPERAPEKALENQAPPKISQGTLETKVTNPDGSVMTSTYTKDGVKSEIVAADGKKSYGEMGSIKLTGADFGIDFYPGSSAKAGSGLKGDSANKRVTAITLESNDNPEAIANFYRSQLKAIANGRELDEFGSIEASLSLGLRDRKTRESLQVVVTKASPANQIALTLITVRP
jgi:YD repeat-containing protein